MKWIKKGLIFSAKENFSWMKTHASVPTADNINDDLFRIYFSTRDDQNRATVGYIEIDIQNPTKILNISQNPVLSLGELGTFDESGVMASSLVNFGNKKYLYYIGWNRPITVPFRLSIGLAISDDGGKTFEKFSKGPILDRNFIDPILVSAPTVILEKDIWRMWYISALGWKSSDGSLIAPYHIRYAESVDGINWKREGVVCINFKNSEEFAIGRPSILKEDNIYKMWYSYSSGKYRIGYAESLDGIKWQRKDDEAGINVSKSGWDSEMIEHSFVFKHKNIKYMLYTGNDYGKTGFGYAILDKDQM